MEESILNIGNFFLIQYLYKKGKGKINISPNFFRQVIEFEHMDKELLIQYIRKIVDDLEETNQIKIYNKNSNKSLGNIGCYLISLT